MKRAFTVPPETRARQANASAPEASAWVSANAGSGKTTVLVRRVLRLMLAGIDPGKILCLTYTTAAAANMANRLFDTLAEWVRADDAELERRLAVELDRPPRPAERTLARQLFAHALETPGGLKIQTIHAFCTRVLQSAPFEAGIPAHFEVISETDRAAAVEAAVRRTLGRASDSASDLRASLDRIAEAVDDQRFRDLIDKALGHSEFLLDGDGQVRPMAEIEADLAAVLGASPGVTIASAEAEAVRAIERDLAFADIAGAVMAHGSETARNKDWPPRIALHALGDAASQLSAWHDVFLTAKATERKDVVGKPVLAAVPSLGPRIEAARDAFMAAFERINAARILERSVSLFAIARLILADYAAAKRRLAALDYGDLIIRTRELFESIDAAWLIYKLDAGLDHLLVDEAQDTSRDQWAILNALTAEFLAGHGQRPARLSRTIFAVGDEKQSIYGFQGAAPAEFGRQRSDLDQRFRALERPFHDVRLTVSFRSTRDVIEAVDAVFAQPAAFAGLSSDALDSRTIHETVRGDEGGAVDLWDLVEPDDSEDEVVWNRPVDAPERQAPVQRLARAIARTIKGWIDAGCDDLGQPFQAGDALILMPKRRAAFGAVVRALKDAGVPVAGMDRLRLSTHIAVQDLIALGRAALLPEDDLTLAVVLKSPLFGLDDADLMRLCPGRGGSLRAALQRSADPCDAEAWRRLTLIEELALARGPFGFYTHVLSVLDGRRQMMARLGAEATDAIDAFLVRALEHERREGPSLGQFLNAIAGSADDIKRDLASAAGEVRVMTVHGAKGLEAKTVFIADVGMPPTQQTESPLLTLQKPGRNDEKDVAIWAPRAIEDCAATREARERRQIRAEEEQHRLLYVAMTRAENRLIICGVRPARTKAIAASWYGLIESGLADRLQPIEPLPLGVGRRRFKVTPPLAAAIGEDRKNDEVAADMPDWVHAAVPQEAPPAPPLAPAHALSSADRSPGAGDRAGRADAAARGRFVHLLLQHLPLVEPARRATIARGLARRHALPGDVEAMIAQTLRLLDHEATRALFGEGGMAEVEIGGAIEAASGARAVAGRIDRLLVSDSEVIVADFKTSRRIPADEAAIPLSTLGQLAAYRALLTELYPGRPVRALAIYTAGPAVLEPTAAQLDAALAAVMRV